MMSEARFEDLMRELRAAAPTAPDALRERVRALPQPGASRQLQWRPVLAAAAVIALGIGIGAAAIGGFRDQTSGPRSASSGASGARERVLTKETPQGAELPRGRAFQGLQGNPAQRDFGALSKAPDALAPGGRLQRYETTMELRVKDLSEATKSAIRTTRALDGYVAAADYGTAGSSGDSTLDLRVPIQRVQQAIASFSELGTILSQHISVADLQAQVDTVDRRLAAARATIAKLEAKPSLTPAEQIRLAEAKRTARSLRRSRAGLVQEGTYARVSLQLTTRKVAAEPAAPGRFDRFWDNASEILGKELIAVLYALIVIGPFALLAAAALLAERARRRRADHRLLEEAG